MKILNSNKWYIPFVCIAAVLILAIVSVLLIQPKGSVAIAKKWEPTQASREVKPYAEQAIEIIDDYLHFRLSTTEAKAEFEDLYSRIEKLNISYVSKEYTNADDVIDSCITYLYLNAEELTDSQFWEYRDMLAFQIGKSVSGKTYPAKKDCYDEADKLCEIYFDNHINSAAWYSAYDTDDFTTLSVNMDYINGVDINEVYAALECAWLQFESVQPGRHCSISVTYQYYGQDVFTASAFHDDKDTSFGLYSAIDLHKFDEDELLNREMEFETDNLESLKEEMEKMAKAFDP